MTNLLSKEEVNIKRQFEFDIAKCFAILFMVIVHVFDNMTTTNGYILPNIIEFFGCPPSACIFMFAMGIGMVYTKHNKPKDFFIRGIKLVILGYILNFFRETLLLIIANLFNLSNSYEDVSLFSSLMNVDILQFAGCSFILVALLKKIKLKPYMILIVAVVLNYINNVCIGVLDNTSEYVQYTAGLLIFANSQTSFPLFAWFIYPAIGMCFGLILKHIQNKNIFYLITLILGIVLQIFSAIYIKISNINIIEFFMTDLYFMQTFIVMIWCISIVFILIPIYYLLSIIVKGKMVEIVSYLSNNVNKIYIVQWLTITYTIAIMEVFEINLPDTILAIPIGILIFIVSVAISKLYNKILRLKL